MIFRLAKDRLRPHLGTVDLHHQNLSVVRLSAVCRHWRAVAIEHVPFDRHSLPRHARASQLRPVHPRQADREEWPNGLPCRRAQSHSTFPSA